MSVCLYVCMSVCNVTVNISFKNRLLVHVYIIMYASYVIQLYSIILYIWNIEI